MYVCVPRLCLVFMEGEEAIEFSVTGSTDVWRLSVGAGSQTQDESSRCSQLLSHLPGLVYYNSKECCA